MKNPAAFSGGTFPIKDKTLSPGIQPLPDAVNDAACVMCLGFDPKK